MTESPCRKTGAEYLHSAGKNLLNVTVRPPVVMVRGEGMYLWDTGGKKYLDFIGGWAVTCLGHSPGVLADVLAKQAKLLVNASPSFLNPPMVEFAELLTEVSCFQKVFFASSGAEANEGAIKLARKYGSLMKNDAFEIVTTVNGFHGRTLATMSATGKPHWKTLFEPKVPGFVHVPYGDLSAMENAVNERTCAVMLEPVQGEGGVIAAETEYIRGLRKLCDERGVLLIFDEIQTGIGRTGTLFAYEQFGIEPDIMTLAKGLGGGFPVSALLAKERLDIFDPGDQGGTYCGQPLAMAAGLAVVKEVIDRELPRHAAELGKYLTTKLGTLSERFELSNIRGRGLLVAFDLPDDGGKRIVDSCLEKGLIVNSPKPAFDPSHATAHRNGGRNRYDDFNSGSGSRETGL